jgi:hypothetical protein
MKLFSEKVKYTSTNSSLNILCVEAFEEIFFGVYEIEINKSKYPVEKISEHNGSPVVSVPVTVEGVKRDYPFVLSQGKFEVLFNQNNILNEEYEIVVDTVKDILLSETVEEVEEVEEIITIPEIVDNRREILEQIQKAKKDAHRALQLEKSKNLKEIQAETSKKNKLLKHTLEEARENLVEEFVSISKKIRVELVDESDNRFNEIRETIDNKIEDLANTLSESLKTDFKQSSKIFDKSIKELVKESYNSVQPKIDKELKSIAIDIVEKVSLIEKGLDEKLKDKADVSLIENVEGELNAVAKANIELNDKINKGVNKALSRVGNVDTKVSELTIALSEEVENKISKAEENITNYYSEKLKMLEEKTFDITEETRKYIVNLVTESRNNLISEIRKIKNEKPIEYIVESKGKKQSINSDDLVKDFDKKINSKIDTEVTRLRKYIAVYSGGGSVAVQFANGGTMNGNLTVVGSISASEYLGINVGGSDTLDTVTTRGNVTDNSITVGGLTVTGGISADRIYTTQLDAISANITVIDIKQYELSGFNVQGDCTVHGSVSANRFVTHNGLSSQFVKGDGSLDSNIYLTAESLNSNVILYPTTAASDLSGVFKLVTSPTDPYYNLSAVNVSTGSITTAEKLVGTLASEAGIIKGNPGIINVTILGNIRKTAGGSNAAATFHFHVYKRSSNGTRTLIGISDSTLPSTNDVYAQFLTSLVANFGDWIATDRIVVEFYAQRVEGGSNPTYDFEYGGETPVRILLPLPTDVLLSDYVPYTGATTNLNLGSNNLNAATVSAVGLDITGQSNYTGAGVTFNYDANAITRHRNALGLGTTQSPTFSSVSLSNTGVFTINSASIQSTAVGRIDLYSGTTQRLRTDGNGVLVGGYLSIGQDVAENDTRLNSDATHTLAQRNGLSPQEFRLYNTYTSATSAERATFKFDANRNFIIGTETLPITAAQRSIIIAPGYNISLSATTPVIFPQTWNNSANTFTLLSANVTDTASNASSLLIDLQVGGVSRFRVDKSGNIATPATFVDIGTGRSWRFSGGNLTPLSNNVLNLGGTSLRIANGYFTNVDVTGTLTVGSNTWNGSTITGAQAFSSTTRPTSSGTGTPASNSLITRADLDTRMASSETYFSMLTASGPTCTNSTTLVGSGCSVTLPVGNYILDCQLYVDSSVSNNGGNKAQLVKSDAGTAAGNVVGVVTSSNNATGLNTRMTYDSSIAWAVGTPSVIYTIRGHVFVTVSSVTLEWQFACNSTDAALPVRTPIRGTYIKATRV